MPKPKTLTHRFTIRLPEYLHDAMVKHTLDHDMDYSVFVRLAISSYLTKMMKKSAEFEDEMSAVKTVFSDVSSDDDLPDVSLFSMSE